MDKNATIRDYGKVFFDEMNPKENHYDLYCVAVCDKDTDAIVREEHYLSWEDYRTALVDVPGRYWAHESIEYGWVDVSTIDGDYEAVVTYHISYVLDEEE